MTRARWLLVTFATAFAFAGPAAGGKSDVFVYFRMPSGNIYCGYVKVGTSQASLRCEIRSGLKPLPRKPASCEFDWGAGYELGRTGRAHVLCISDTVYNGSARVVRYGSVWRRGGFVCASKKAGLRCSNASRHGFFLSRQRSYKF